MLYYAVGGYVSSNTRTGKWGTGAIEVISEQLQKELPGLRGFSGRNLKYMRTFFEEWSAVFRSPEGDSAVASAEIEQLYPLGIRHLQVPNWTAGDAEDFLNIGFTHHRTILELTKILDERLFYIRKCAAEHMSVTTLKRSIRANDFEHQGALPNNFLQTLPRAQQALRAIGMFKDE